MELLVIGDIHGLPTWKNVVAACPNADHVLFVGDYLDAFDVSSADQVRNFGEIIAFRQNAPAGYVTLLIGNHDYHYLSYVNDRFSGYDFATQRVLRERVDEMVKAQVLVAGAYVDGRLYTHAGVTKTWAADCGIDAAPEDLPDALNELLFHRPRAFTFQPPQNYTDYDPTGDSIWQGPLWVRPRSLRADAYCGGQIFGHTVLPKGARIRPQDIGFSIDALFSGQYIVVTDGVAEVRRL